MLGCSRAAKCGRPDDADGMKTMMSAVLSTPRPPAMLEHLCRGTAEVGGAAVLAVIAKDLAFDWQAVAAALIAAGVFFNGLANLLKTLGEQVRAVAEVKGKAGSIDPPQDPAEGRAILAAHLAAAIRPKPEG